MPAANPESDRIVSYTSANGHEGQVRARYFRHGASRVLVLTDIEVPPHRPSVTNNIIQAIAAVDDTGLAAARLAEIIEHCGGERESFDLVTVSFLPSGRIDHAVEPRWVRTNRADVETRIGGRLL